MQDAGSRETPQLDCSPIHIEAPTIDIAVHYYWLARMQEVQYADYLATPRLQHMQSGGTCLANKFAQTAVAGHISDKYEGAWSFPRAKKRKEIGVADALEQFDIVKGKDASG